MVKMKETSFLSTRGMYLSCHGCISRDDEESLRFSSSKNLKSAHKCGVPFFCPLDALCSHVKRSINQTLFAQFLLGKRVSLLHKDLCIIQGIPAQCSMKKTKILMRSSKCWEGALFL